MEIIKERNRVAGEVRASRARNGISITDLSRRSGISASALSRKLRGEASFTVDDLFMLAPVLGNDVSEFFPKSLQK